MYQKKLFNLEHFSIFSWRRWRDSSPIQLISRSTASHFSSMFIELMGFCCSSIHIDISASHNTESLLLPFATAVHITILRFNSPADLKNVFLFPPRALHLFRQSDELRKEN
jgi:hypothetical protein